MLTLEEEFAREKFKHQYTIVKYKLVRYFRDLEDNSPQIPDFMRIGQRPEDKADREIRNLIMKPDGARLFQEAYNRAYTELSEVLS